MKIEYVYVDPINPPQEYFEMLLKWYGEKKWNRFKKTQFEWYQQYPYFKIYAVKVDDLFVGQAAAFGVNFYNGDKINELWWGVDTFLLNSYRGNGIGKQLQKHLHDSLTNFTSAAYTPINGIIKKKCGCQPLFNKNTWYYGVSNYFVLLSSIMANKKLRVRLPSHSILPNFYLWFKRRRYKKYIVGDAMIDDNLVNFINETLKSEYDFFVWRSVSYMKWKYDNNPAFNYKLLSFSISERIEAVLGYTDIHNYSLGGRSISSVKILDLVIRKGSKLTSKDLLVFVADYYKHTHKPFDGILALQECEWYPRLCVPRPVLSTLCSEIRCPYITFLDQDMEQEM